MSDFASAVMVRVLRHGLHDLSLDPGDPPPESASARVELEFKRTLLGRAVAQGGLACLPLLGRGVRHLRGEPTHDALTCAHDPADLLARWQRLERYVHTRHRCVLLGASPESLSVRHVSLHADEAPTAVEDLVVLGVIAALMEEAGARGVEVHLAQAPVLPQPREAVLREMARAGTTATWTFRWQAVDECILPPAPAAGRPVLPADAAWPAIARAVWERLVLDLMQPPSGPALASHLDTPWRTLQRRLAAAGLSLTGLLAEARCRAGAWRLIHTGDPIAEVGFLCGYADQSHFTRALRRRVGMTPAAYRAAFSTGAAASRMR